MHNDTQAEKSEQYEQKAKIKKYFLNQNSKYKKEVFADL